MSAKKRFSINPELASGLRNTIQSAASKSGQLHYDSMDLTAIELDPENPRKLKIKITDVLNGLVKSDPDYATKLKELESLQELATSIKAVGLRSAIEVYKEDHKYRVISGERRYLASLLAEQKYVPVRISQKPNEYNLRYIQWVENINREDLSLPEKYHNLKSISAAFKQSNGKDMDVAELKQSLGISDSQAYRYYSLINADKDVIEMLENGQITSLQVFCEIANIKSKAQRNELLKNFSSQNITSKDLARSKIKKQQKNPAIKLALATSPQVAKYIYYRLATDPALKSTLISTQVDWSNPTMVNKAFKKLYLALEQLSTNEIENAL